MKGGGVVDCRYLYIPTLLLALELSIPALPTNQALLSAKFGPALSFLALGPATLFPSNLLMGLPNQMEHLTSTLSSSIFPIFL